jgi:hypothetical protein
VIVRMQRGRLIQYFEPPHRTAKMFGFNRNVEKCPNVARRAARTLIGPVGALAAEQSHIVLYNCANRVGSDQVAVLLALRSCVSQLTNGQTFSVIATTPGSTRS